MNIPFRFSGLQSLKIKETDRMAALIQEMGKLGYILHETDDRILSWEGERCEMTADVAIDTYEDHRMAMAFAPACVVMPEIRINNPQVVFKILSLLLGRFTSSETLYIFFPEKNCKEVRNKHSKCRRLKSTRRRSR